MRSELAKEITLIVSIKLIVLALIWYLFFADTAAAIDPAALF